MPGAMLTTTISKEWKRRMILITLVALGAGTWFLYDGLWAWPRNNDRWAIYAPLKEQFADQPDQLRKAWTDASREHGWSTPPPKKFYQPSDLLLQKILGSAALLAGLLCLVHYLRSLKTSLHMDDQHIHLPDGRTVSLEQIRSISLRRWRNKGIADISYDPGQGVTKKFPLDDYKYVGAEEILKVAQAHLADKEPSNPKPDAGTPPSHAEEY